MRLREDADDDVGAAMVFGAAPPGGGVRLENGQGDQHQAASRLASVALAINAASAAVANSSSVAAPTPTTALQYSPGMELRSAHRCGVD